MWTSGAEVDASYRIARGILIDALEALAPYGFETVIVVGAQAIYLRCEDEGESPIAPPFTLDSDFVLDLKRRTHDVSILAHLTGLGYSLRDRQPGLYQAPNLPPEARQAGGIDLFVPEAYAFGDNRRDANIPDDPRAARRQYGLELALFDRAPMLIQSLLPGNNRSIQAMVAGPAALLVSKLVKINERLHGDTKRIEPKDALDVYRLLRSHETDEFVQTLRLFGEYRETKPLIADAILCLQNHFITAPARALVLLGDTLQGYPTRASVIEATRILSDDLLRGLEATR